LVGILYLYVVLTWIGLESLSPHRSLSPQVGEVLHAVDFEQLQIENAQHSERIGQKNSELLKLKLTSSNISQVRGVEGR
jgi:hypothetical protein